MRSRSELYDILVNELRIDNAKATEILDNAFALHDDETKKIEERDEKVKELKEKFVGKLLYITTGSLPIFIFVNDIKESYSYDYFDFVGPHIILDENEYYFYSSKASSLTIGQNEFDKIEIINDLGHISLSKKQFIKQFLYYQLLGKRVESCMNKFIDECKID